MRYPTISMRELDCWITCNRPMELIDLRNRAAYECSHLKGAINIPFEELEEMIQEEQFCLCSDLPLVFYACLIICVCSSFWLLIGEAGL